jgi:pimeloyl-ACP methyl ester carboxylesterase
MIASLVPEEPRMPDPTHVAAAVSYRPVSDPSDRPTDYAAPPGARLDYYELTSLDGRTGLAAHLVPDRPAAGVPLVISVHGSGGSIGSQPVRLLSLGLGARGVPVLAINTRQTGDAVNTDNFYATVRDIEAAYWMARDLGYDRIVLHGHSLGTSQVSCFAATHWHGTTAGIVLTGMFADLPWKSRHLLINDEKTYAELTGEAVEAVQGGDYSRVLPAGMPWLGGRTMPVTAQHFLTYRRVGLAGARSVEWIKRIPYPLLMVRDENDPVIEYFEPGWLEAALADGLSPAVSSALLPSAAPSNGHAFEKSGDLLVKTVHEWITSLHTSTTEGTAR